MRQLIEVNIGKDISINLKEWENGWYIIKTIKPVYIGKNGASLNKIEGDFKTPLGLFKIGPAFGTHPLNLNYPYLMISENSYWVADHHSKFYNQWVEVNGNLISNYSYIQNSDKITWKECEHLSDYPIQYEMGFVIEYNCPNPIKGKGSAIFFHVKNKDYTAGCIAVNKKDMEYILTWLDQEKDPHILIQTKKD